MINHTKRMVCGWERMVCGGVGDAETSEVSTCGLSSPVQRSDRSSSRACRNMKTSEVFTVLVPRQAYAADGATARLKLKVVP
jgi:hypothetical protein